MQLFNIYYLIKILNINIFYKKSVLWDIIQNFYQQVIVQNLN